MATGLNDYLRDLQKASLGEFKPEPYYEADLDSLIFYARNEPCYAKRLNSLLTVFLSTADDRLVGCEVKGIRNMLRLCNTFKVMVQDRRVPLGMFLAFALVEETKEPGLRGRYQDALQEVTRDVQLDIDNLIPAA
jgi:hypothetical protein